MIRRFAVALAFVGLVLSASTGQIAAQDLYQGAVTSCSEVGVDYVDSGAAVSVTANDGRAFS